MISGALGHLLREAAAAPAPPALSPGIAAQLGTTAEESAKQAAEDARQARILRDRELLWPAD